MTTAQITLGPLTVSYNTDTLVITSELSQADYRQCQNKCLDEAHFTNDTDVFQFDANGVFDCIIFTGGENYIGDYDATVETYIETDGYQLREN